MQSPLDEGYQVKAFRYYKSFNCWGWLENLPKEKLNEVEIFIGDIRDPNGGEDGHVVQFGVPPNRIGLLNEIEGINFVEAWKEKTEE